MRRLAAAIFLVFFTAYVIDARRHSQVIGSNVVAVYSKPVVANAKKLSASNQLMYLLLRYAQRHCHSAFILKSNPGLDDLDSVIGNMSVVGQSLIDALDASRPHRVNGAKAMKTMTDMQCTYARGISMILKMEIDGAAKEHNSTCTQLSWVAQKAHRYRYAGISKLRSALQVAARVEMSDIKCIKYQMKSYVTKLESVRRYFMNLKHEKSNYVAAKKAGTIMLVMIVQYADIAHEVTKLQQAKTIMNKIRERIIRMQTAKKIKDRDTKARKLACSDDNNCVEFLSRQARMTRSIYGMLRESAAGRVRRTVGQPKKDKCGLTITSEIPKGGIELHPGNRLDTDALFRQLKKADHALLADVECFNRLLQSVTSKQKRPLDQKTEEETLVVDEFPDDPIEMPADMSGEMSADGAEPLAEAETTVTQVIDAKTTTAHFSEAETTTAQFAEAETTTAQFADGKTTTAQFVEAETTTAQFAEGETDSKQIAEDETTTNHLAEDEEDEIIRNATQATTTIGIDIEEGEEDDDDDQTDDDIRELQQKIKEFQSAVGKLQELKQKATLSLDLPPPATDAEDYASALKETVDAIAMAEE